MLEIISNLKNMERICKFYFILCYIYLDFYKPMGYNDSKRWQMVSFSD